VLQYKGFKEHAYRLLFPYEDNFPDKEPALLTILPTGVIETTKILVPEKERGLLSYPFGQLIDKSVMEGQTVNYEQSPWHGKPYTETPFVKDIRVGQQHALVQTWPTKINDTFKHDFKMFDTNPDLKKFNSAAVVDYKACIEELFGPDALKKKQGEKPGEKQGVTIKYCHKVTTNDFPCYRGTTEDLLTYLKDNKEVLSNIGIKEMSEKGFVASGEDGKGNKVEKSFSMQEKTEYVIYKKVGWETMGCCKTLEQFEKECEFVGKGKWISRKAEEETK